MNNIMQRVEILRTELFAAIDKAIEIDGHHKSYEGTIEFTWPNRFNNTYLISLACYVIGPNRHACWEGISFDEALTKAENDIRKWIPEYTQEQE